MLAKIELCPKCGRKHPVTDGPCPLGLREWLVTTIRHYRLEPFRWGEDLTSVAAESIIAHIRQEIEQRTNPYVAWTFDEYRQGYEHCRRDILKMLEGK